MIGWETYWEEPEVSVQEKNTCKHRAENTSMVKSKKGTETGEKFPSNNRSRDDASGARMCVHEYAWERERTLNTLTDKANKEEEWEDAALSKVTEVYPNSRPLK